MDDVDPRMQPDRTQRCDDLAALAVEYARSFRGRWYRWGGDDPSGFDCSGLVVEVLQSVGLFPSGQDAGAQTLYRRYPLVQVPRPGCLAYWGSGPEGISHVEIVVAVHGDVVLTVGASGGGAKTRSVEDAMRANAFVKQRPVVAPGRRTDFVGYNDPFLGVG